MKTLVFLLLALPIRTVYCQEIDSLEVMEIPVSYADRIGEPLMVQKDRNYVFRTSDIYLVNKKSFLAIKNVYQSAVNQDKMTSDLIEKYTQTLRRNIDLEQKLSINFMQNDSLDLHIHQKNQTTIGLTQKALDYTIYSLEQATNSLELIEQRNRRHRKKTILENILIGIAGIGAGALIGTSL